MQDILKMVDITKVYPGVVANDHINFTLRKGEVHSLLGENGAGKSTLMNILSGVIRPTGGSIELGGEHVAFETARDAIRKGIGMVYQHFMLVPQLTVAENIMLGIKRAHEPLLQINKAADEIVAFAKTYGMHLDPHTPVWQLSVGEQQRVEIIKALYRGARVLVLDEPTAVLTPGEITELFRMIRMFLDQEFSVIFISHKMDEVLKISDRISVLRRGRLVETLDNTPDLTKRELASLMVGREVNFEVEKCTCKAGKDVLTLQNLCANNNKGLPALKQVSMCVHAGEIVGVAGVDGNGQSELLEVVTGLRNPTEGKVCLNGEDITGHTPRSILEKGLAHIPEDRHVRGLVLDLDIKENFMSNDYYREPHSRKSRLDWPFIRKHTQTNIEKFDVRTPSIDVKVSSLSGGNQQKLVLARELHGEPVIVTAMHATRGLDVGAIEYVHKQIITQRDQGTAVLYISTELDELMTLADRLIVLCHGEIMGEVDPKEVSIETVGLMMAGERLEEIVH